MSRFVNKNFKALVNWCTKQEYEDEVLIKGKRGGVLEGSSRSSKTVSSIDFIILLCVRYETNCTINVVKETYAEFKTTLYDDFSKRLKAFGLPSPFDHSNEVKTFKIFGNRINFLGADKLSKFHGVSCDYLYINEALPIEKSFFDQLEMRCRKFWWVDYNPSVTQHWIFDSIIPRPDVGYCHSTFRDNPFISTQERNKILSYEPWLPGSYSVRDNDIIYNGEPIGKGNFPPPHPVNIQNGTADEYMWKVYGLGLRGAMEGIIFKNVVYIDKFPAQDNTLGFDIGFVSDPSAIVKYTEDPGNIYVELLCYEPTETPEDVDSYMTAIGLSKSTSITADSSDRYVSEKKGVIQMVLSLRQMGWSIKKVSKTKGVAYWISSMKKKRINIVKNHLYSHAKKEQENYIWKEVNGVALNIPEDKYNHFWDACFPAGTSVLTTNGVKSIENIYIGDVVINSFGERLVLYKWNNGKKTTFEFSLLFDTFPLTLRATENHKVKTDKGWIEISKLESGMMVYISSHLMGTATSDHFAVKAVLSKIVISNPIEENVYDLTIADNHEYFANGLLVHNCRYAHMAWNQSTEIETDWE